MGNIQEVTLAMVHDKANKAIYKDFLLLDDNFFDEVVKGLLYVGKPVKMLFFSMIVCIKGKMRIRVNLKEMTIGPNDVFLGNPGAIIDMIVCEGECRMAVVHVDNEKIAHYPTSRIFLQFRSVVKNEAFVTHFSDSSLHQFVEAYKMMRRIVSDETLRFKDEALEGCFQTMASYWMNEIAIQNELEKPAKLSRNEQLFQTFLQLVSGNYMKRRDVSFYADEMCITPKYLGVVVAQVSGRRPLDWIRDYVILDAKAMLLSREYSIQQISQILNFANPSFFSKYFREAVGFSPSRYLNEEKV